jgi:hypothetical protein
MKTVTFVSALLVFVLGSMAPLFAVNYYVRAGAAGNQNGTDWTNAYNQLPAKLIRGGAYYIAAGTYPAHTFDDPDDGTKVIAIKAVTQADHGTDTGWVSSFIGQAVFQSATTVSSGAMLYFRTDYYTVNGQYRGADWKSGYGFKIDNSNKKAAIADILIGDSNPTLVHDLSIQFVEINGSHPTGDVCNEEGIESPVGAYNLTFGYLYNHDVGNCNFFLRGGGGANGKGGNITVEYCFIADNYSSPTYHGEGFSCSEGLKNFTIRYNYLEDMIGTAYIATPSGGGWTTTNVNNGPWYIYGNIFNGLNKTHCGTGDGAIFFFDVNFTDNVYIYNNTFSHLGSSDCNGAYSGGIQLEPVEGTMKADMKGVYISNNLWINASDVSMGCTTCSAYEWSYNAYFEMADNSAAKDPDGSKQISTNCPIVDWQQNNFNLTMPTNAGKVLPVTYDQDIFGTIRSSDSRWDRGAAEFTGKTTGVAVPLQAPVETSDRPKVIVGAGATGVIKVAFQLSSARPVTLDIFNSLGQKAATIVRSQMGAGQQTISINRNFLPNGMYVYRLQCGIESNAGHFMLM